MKKQPTNSVRAWGLCLTALLTMTILGSHTNAQPYSKLVAFGDSHSDTGNWAEITDWSSWMDPSYLVGRFSNGPVWVEELATQLEVSSPTPSEAGGFNYAWGGARTGHGNDSLGGGPQFPKVGTQIGRYLDVHAPDGDELVTLFAGHNDFGWGFASNSSIIVENIGNHVATLAGAGVTQFLVPNLHPLGHLPAYRGTGREASLDALTLDFNVLLAAELSRRESELGVAVFQFDFYSFAQNAVADPLSFGLHNVTDRAFSQGVVVPDPDAYLYWDNHHFSAAFYAMMGRRAGNPSCAQASRL